MVVSGWGASVTSQWCEVIISHTIMTYKPDGVLELDGVIILDHFTVSTPQMLLCPCASVVFPSSVMYRLSS